MDQLVFPRGATLSNTIGAIQIGLPLSAFLFGILTLQVYYYFENHKGDGNSLRWLVRAIWFLELVDTVFLIGTVYRLSVTAFRQVDEVPGASYPSYITFHCPKLLIAALLISGCSNSAVQLVFTHQIHRLLRSWELTTLCTLLVGFQMALISLQGFYTTRAASILDFAEDHKAIILATFGVTIVLDFIIVSSLWSREMRKERSISQMTFQHLSYLVGGTGVAQCVIGLAALITLSIMRGNYVWLALRLFATEVYANSLMLWMNGRRPGDEPCPAGGVTSFIRSNTVCLNRPPMKVEGIHVETTNITETNAKDNRDTNSIATLEGGIIENKHPFSSIFETHEGSNTDSPTTEPNIPELDAGAV